MSETTLPPMVVTAPAAPPPAEPPAPASGAAQWLRKLKLIVMNERGQGLDLSDLRVTFQVRAADIQTPNTADIMVYNLSDETARLVQAEFKRVTLQAGYASNFGTIFEGTVKQFRRGRESPVDTYLNLRCADGDVAYNWATINVTLAAGATAQDTLAKIEEALRPFNVTLGYVADLPDQPLPRAQTYSGMVRDALRDLSAAWGMSWSIQSGRLTILPLTGRALPGDAIVLNSASGMIGMPEQTLDGILARALLNPRLEIGRTVQIDNHSVQQGKYAFGYQAEVMNNLLKDVRIAEDGFYRVLCADHIGDTRGQHWYTDIVCIAVGDPITIQQAARGRI